MQKQKRGFWLFIFSLIPGAGEMYMGFKKQGISIMLLFWGVFAVGSCTGMDWLIFLIPIIWFYSFFNVHNLKSLSEEEFYSVEDSYVLHMDKLIGDVDTLLTHHRKLTAIVLIVFGASILWNNLVDFFYMILPGYLANVLGTFAYHLPQLVIAVAIIFAGLGQKAVVRMPKGTTRTRFDNIAKEGATVTIEEVNYDDCVRMAAAEAAKTEHGIIVQDTAWDGYEEIPSWIMQGYGTLVLEADQQLKEMGVERPTHVFVQAGVGSLAGAVVGYFAHKYKDNPPVMAVCEASAADCLYRSAVAKTGNLVNVTGDLQTIMAGLACGEGNMIGWDILKNHVDVFASCPDWMSAKATRIYANPLGDDPHVVSGESGSVPLGFCFTALHDEDAKDLKEALKLDENSVVLVISTEGDTDPVRYREIVWDGLYGTDESLSK